MNFFLKKVINRDSQGIGDVDHSLQARVLFSAFDLTDVRLINLCSFGKLFLRKSVLSSFLSDSLTQVFEYHPDSPFQFHYMGC